MTSPKASALTEREIESIVEDYLLNALPLKQKLFQIPHEEENLKRCLFGQQDFLIISKCKLHELPINVLRRLPIYLIKEFAIQVEYDSLWFWALTHDIVRYARAFCRLGSWQVMQSFETMMAAHFATLNVGFSPSGIGRWALERLNRATGDIVSEPIKDLVGNTETVLMYVCYPVLESLTKFALSPLVDCDGKTQEAFTVGGTSIKKGSVISSLAVTLRMLEEHGTNLLSKPELSNNMRDCRLEVEKMPITKMKEWKDGWDLIYSLRNKSLHGSTGWQLRSGLITNLICLILWNILDDQIIRNELERIATRMPRPFQWNYYYPPEL